MEEKDDFYIGYVDEVPGKTKKTVRNFVVLALIVLIETALIFAFTQNTFKNNPVQFIATLWGAKNNAASGNEINNSGKITVEENLKLKLMY